MPFSVYALKKGFPRVLRYRDTSLRLEIVPGKIRDEWVFQARKFLPPAFCAITGSRCGRLALEAELLRGFLVEDETPAARILARLVSLGHATKRPANARDF